jgi:ADP-ribosyl-[dinitrogen reductase] hydrolase
MHTYSSDDPLLPVARLLAIQNQNPSVAFLQRMLKLSYQRAEALMQGLEGTVVSAPDATGWRHLLASGIRSPDAPTAVGHTAKKTSNEGSADTETLDRTSRAQGALLGLAVGDALGTSVEFMPRGTFAPVTDMRGGGPFDLQPGQWTDDTSMALCLGASLIAQGFDMQDQLTRYLDWHDKGYMSSTGECFDIGGTTHDALERHRQTGAIRAGSADPDDAGNGSIMRLAPVVLYFLDNPTDAIHYAAEQSKTTHRAPECLMACQLMAETLLRALQGKPKDEVLAPSQLHLVWTPGMLAVAQGEYLSKTTAQIFGTGYVVQSLEAALWCFATTNSYEDCVLTAANLGDDADTTAAVAGQIAGAFYGIDAIPHFWRARVHLEGDILRMSTALVAPKLRALSDR